MKNVKTFMGMEGPGFNATLYRDGNKVCFLIDEAIGGCYNYQWQDGESECVDIIYKHSWDYKKKEVKSVTFRGTPEEKLFYEYIDTLPKEPGTGIFPEPRYPDNDTVIAHMVDEYEEAKFFKGKCKKKTIVITKDCKEGHFLEYNSPYNPAIVKFIKQKLGDNLVEIINERFI